MYRRINSLALPGRGGTILKLVGARTADALQAEVVEPQKRSGDELQHEAENLVVNFMRQARTGLRHQRGGRFSAMGPASPLPRGQERVRSYSKSVRDTNEPPHPHRAMSAPVRRHVNAPGAAGGADEAFHPRDVWEGRFWRKADSLEAQGRRAQADGIAARHPCAGDAMGLKIGGGGRSEAVHRELLLSARPRRGKAHDVCDEQVMMSVSGPDKIK